MERVRPPAVAGAFYPSDAEELNALLDDCFLATPQPPTNEPSAARIIAGMVPHAGYVYSGGCAAHFYCCLDPSIERIVLLGVNHRASGHRAALSVWDGWETPLGTVRVDSDANAVLKTRVSFLERDSLPHAREHSIEVQLPFLQKVLGDFSFVPISLSELSIQECAELGTAIAELYELGVAENIKTIIIASSDLNHYLPPKKILALDRLAIDQILALDPAGLIEIVDAQGLSMCGVLPTAVMLFAAKALGVDRVHLLKHCHSGDARPMDEVVGYASIALER